MLETPVALTNTLSVFTVADGLVDHTLSLSGNESVRAVNPVAEELKHHYLANEAAHQVDGSCMIVIATDAPLSARNLERLAKRSFLALGRVGSFMSNGSGGYDRPERKNGRSTSSGAHPEDPGPIRGAH